MRYQVRHLTTYWYDSPVQMSHNAARLHPRTTDRQRCENLRIDITPRPAEMGLWAPDYFGNPVLFFRVQQPHRVLTVEVESEVEVMAPPTRLPFETPPWEAVRDRLRRPREEQEFAAAEFLYDSPLVPHLGALAAYAAESFLPRRPVLDAVLDLTHRIHADFAYDPAATDVSTPLVQAFELRRGVCQDFAHLEIAALRAMGIPARYVSGYVLTHPPPGGQKLVGGDASHAWVSAWLPDLGWVDVDPTNDSLVKDEHVTLAWGRDFEDVSPLKGVVLGGGEHAPHVEVDVKPLEEVG